MIKEKSPASIAAPGDNVSADEKGAARRWGFKWKTRRSSARLRSGSRRPGCRDAGLGGGDARTQASVMSLKLVLPIFNSVVIQPTSPASSFLPSTLVPLRLLQS